MRLVARNEDKGNNPLSVSLLVKNMQSVRSIRASEQSMLQDPGVVSRAALAHRVNEARAQLRLAIKVQEAEVLALQVEATAAATTAIVQLNDLRSSGALTTLRPWRFAHQLARAWRAKRVALCTARLDELCMRFEEASDYAERLWTPEGFDEEVEAGIVQSDIVCRAPEELLTMCAPIEALRCAEEPLADLRNEAMEQYEQAQQAAKVGGRDSRRRLIMALVRGDGRSGEPSHYTRDIVHHEVEALATSLELTRLLLSPGTAERSLINHWRAAVTHAAEETSTTEVGVAEHTAPTPSVTLPSASFQMLVPHYTHVLARQLLVAGGLPGTFLPVLEYLMGRLLIQMVEPVLLRRALDRHTPEDAQLAAQQRWMHALTPTELEVSEYVVCQPGSGLPVLQPLAPALEALSALSFEQTPRDFAMRIVKAVKLINSHCANTSGQAAIGADVLVPMMVLLVIHARLPCGYSLLQHAKAYMEPNIVRSEIGYCLCTYEAALEHVRCYEA